MTEMWHDESNPDALNPVTDEAVETVKLLIREARITLLPVLLLDEADAALDSLLREAEEHEREYVAKHDAVMAELRRERRCHQRAEERAEKAEAELLREVEKKYLARERAKKAEASRERVLALFEEAGQNVDRLEAENERLREFYNAHCAVEDGVASFDLHNAAVERLDRARQALGEEVKT